MSTDYVDHLNNTEKRDLLLASMTQTVSKRIERIPKWNKRNGLFNQHILKNENVAIDWIDYKKGRLQGSPSILDCRLSEYVQDIQQSHKIHHGSHEKLESGNDSGRKMISRSEIKKGIINGVVLFPLILVLTMKPLNDILRKCTENTNLQNRKISRIDDRKLSVKKEKKKDLVTDTNNTNI